MNQTSRRLFLKKGIHSSLLLLLPTKALAAMRHVSEKTRTLSFYNLHTRETLKICYFKDNTYQSDALSKINHLLRDHRTGESTAMDPQLLDALYEIKAKLKTTTPFHIISGFRSPKSNAMLRNKSKSSGVAKKSLHMKGMAIDIRLPGFDLKALYQTCVDVKKGGVGYYEKSNFVHIDTGRVRYW